jgi:hypothetical protein
MSSVSRQDIDQAIDGAFGPGTPRTVTMHDSGAVSIVIKVAGRIVLIDGTATQTEWGISVDPEDEAAFTGHPESAASLTDALRTAHATITG